MPAGSLTHDLDGVNRQYRAPQKGDNWVIEAMPNTSMPSTSFASRRANRRDIELPGYLSQSAVAERRRWVSVNVPDDLRRIPSIVGMASNLLHRISAESCVDDSKAALGLQREVRHLLDGVEGH